MRDPQSTPPLPSRGIPLISPLLHILSMPVLVFWRYRLGYAIFRPKKIFLALIFAVTVLSYIAWNDPEIGVRYRALSVFAIAASVIYICQLISNMVSQKDRLSEHDQFSGESRLELFLPKAQRDRLRLLLHCIVEPLLTATAGILSKPDPLGSYLILAGFSLAAKEAISAWLNIRVVQVGRDGVMTAKEMGDIHHPAQKPIEPAAGRTEEEAYPRKQNPSEGH